jgi:hypothetical protein
MLPQGWSVPVTANANAALWFRANAHQLLLLGQSEPAVSRRQRLDHMTQTTQIALLFRGTVMPLSLSLSLLLAVAIHLNGSDKKNPHHDDCGCKGSLKRKDVDDKRL